MKKEKKYHRKRPVLFLMALFLFAAGAGIFMYPLASNFMAERSQMRVIRNYDASVRAMSQQKRREEAARAYEYNMKLSGEELKDSFSRESSGSGPAGYEELLNESGDGVMAYVEIPDIGVKLPVYHGTGEEVLQKGAGHLAGSSLPVGGPGTHAVISAHRGLPSARLFTDLDEMEKGDIFYIHVLGQIHAYQVARIDTVKPDEMELLGIEPGQDLVTLLTCTPYAVNTHRLIVRGQRIPYQKQKSSSRSEERRIPEWMKEYGTAAAAGMAAAGAAAGVWKFRKRRRKR